MRLLINNIKGYCTDQQWEYIKRPKAHSKGDFDFSFWQVVNSKSKY